MLPLFGFIALHTDWVCSYNLVQFWMRHLDALSLNVTLCVYMRQRGYNWIKSKHQRASSMTSTLISGVYDPRLVKTTIVTCFIIWLHGSTVDFNVHLVYSKEGFKVGVSPAPLNVGLAVGYPDVYSRFFSYMVFLFPPPQNASPEPLGPTLTSAFNLSVSL